MTRFAFTLVMLGTLLGITRNSNAQHTGTIVLQSHRVNGDNDTVYDSLGDDLRYSALSVSSMDPAIFWSSLHIKVQIFRNFGIFSPQVIYQSGNDVTWPAVEANPFNIRLDAECTYTIEAPLEPYYFTNSTLYYMDAAMDVHVLDSKFGAFTLAVENGVGG